MDIDMAGAHLLRRRAARVALMALAREALVVMVRAQAAHMARVAQAGGEPDNRLNGSNRPDINDETFF